MQTYSIFKIFFSLRENIDQNGLQKLGLWTLGELGELLINGKAIDAEKNSLIVINRKKLLFF